jgi:hypothetical protein
MKEEQVCQECGHEVEAHVTRETSIEALAQGVPFAKWTSCDLCSTRARHHNLRAPQSVPVDEGVEA